MAQLSVLSEETLSVSGVFLSRSFGRQCEEIARFRTLNTHLAQLQVRQQMIGQGLFTGLRIFFAVMPVLAYLAAGFLLAGGGAATTQLSAGTLVAFTSLQLQLLSPIYSLLQMAVQVQSSLALFERIFEYLDLPHDIVDAPDAITLPPRRVRGGDQRARRLVPLPQRQRLGPRAPRARRPDLRHRARSARRGRRRQRLR